MNFQKRAQLIFGELELLDKDGEIDSGKIAPFVESQMKNFTENSGDAALLEKWTPIMKEAFEVCANRSDEVDHIDDPETGNRLKSVNDNIEPIMMMQCINLYAFAVIS